MTLISLTLNHGIPIMIGDILVTSKTMGQSDSVVTPQALLGVGDFLKDIVNKPYKLHQKIYVINPNLCIGLAGRLDQMTSCMRSLRSYFRDGVTETELKEWLNDYEKDKLVDLAAVGICISPIEGKPEMLNAFRFTLGDITKTNSDQFGETYAIGTGASQFIDLVNKGTNTYSGKKTNIPFDQERWRMALARNLQLFGTILGNEAFYMNTIRNAWGAGLEAITLKNGSFFKLPEITISIFLINYNWDKKKIEGFVSIATMKYHYHNSALIIDSMNNEKSHRFIVPELDKETSDYDLSSLPAIDDFNSLNTTLLYYIPRKNGVGHHVKHAVLLRDSTQTEARFLKFIINSDRSVTMDIDSSFKISIEEQLAKGTWPD